MAERRDEIIEACKRLHVSRLDVFGSAANETFDPGRSDVDFKPGVSLTLYSDLKEAFERILGRDIDLVERRAIMESRNYIRRERILSEAAAIYVA